MPLSMLAGAALAAMAALPIRTFEAGFGQRPVLVLAPHPDDESLGCGGMIAQACGEGRPPWVVVLTDGGMSHPKSRLYPRERLRRLREEETIAATGLLGLPPERLTFLGYRDTEAPTAGAELQRAVGDLVGLIAATGCATVVTAWQHDPHCDHEAAAIIARLACDKGGTRLLAYPVWGRTLAPGQAIGQGSVTGFRLDVRHRLLQKRAAIHAHRSQYAGIIGDDPGGFQMRAGFIDLFLDSTEIYLECP